MIIDGIVSATLPTNSGVPQGSCLGPLLFNLYTNDISKLLLSALTIQYADDTVLTLTGSSLFALATQLNADLSILTDWCKANKLSLNVRKTKAMLFTPRQIDNFPQISIDHNPIEFVTSYKYLGITIDKELEFKTYLTSLKNKLARVAGLSYKFGKIVNLNTAKSMYYSMAYSHIIYLISIWGHSSITRVNDIQVQQNKIIRNLFSPKFPALNTDSLFDTLSMLKIKDIFTLELGKLMYLTINSNRFHRLNDILVNLQWSHNYNTRKICMYRLPKIRVLPDYNSFIFQGVDLWNNFPILIRGCQSYHVFKKELKAFLLQSNSTNDN